MEEREIESARLPISFKEGAIMLYPESPAKFGVQGMGRAPQFGQVVPRAAIRQMGARPMNTTMLRQPGIQATKPLSTPEASNNGKILVGILALVGSVAGVAALRNVSKMPAMVRKANTELAKSTMQAAKTPTWAKWGLGSVSLLSLGGPFGVYGAFRKMEKQAAAAAIDANDPIIKGINTEITNLKNKPAGGAIDPNDPIITGFNSKINALETRATLNTKDVNDIINDAVNTDGTTLKNQFDNHSDRLWEINDFAKSSVTTNKSIISFLDSVSELVENLRTKANTGVAAADHIAGVTTPKPTALALTKNWKELFPE
jgi:hypothetical protein